MPRYKGIGMPKAKKKAVVQLSEAQDESSDPPGPSEPPAPPSPDSKQVDRKGQRQAKGYACAHHLQTHPSGSEIRSLV